MSANISHTTSELEIERRAWPVDEAFISGDESWKSRFVDSERDAAKTRADLNIW